MFVVDGSLGHTFIRRQNNGQQKDGEAVAKLSTGGTIADAHLLAASADLKDALKLMLDMPDYDGKAVTSKIRREAKRKARLALDKADGK